MKKLFFIISAVFFFASCETPLDHLSDRPADDRLEAESRPDYYTEEFSEGVVNSILAFCDYAEDGDVVHIYHTSEGLDWDVVKDGTTYDGEHAFTSTNRLEFAKWCDKQLKAGKCLNIGYYAGSGTYYADFTPC